VSATPAVSTAAAAAERKQTDRQVTKTARSSEADAAHQTSTDVLRSSAVSDISTIGIATLTSADLRSN